MSEIVKVLKAARELISDPARWTQFESARDEFGNPIPARDQKACSFCSVGAFSRVCMDFSFEVRDAAEEAFYEAIGSSSIATFNDSHTHPEVLAAFDAAIARLA